MNEQQIADSIWQEERKLTAGIDVKDVSFVALSLQTDAYLWTGDKPLHDGLIKRGFTKVVNTEELLLLLQHID